MPRAMSPMEMPSSLERRISILITPGDSFIRALSAAMRSTCSPSKVIRRMRSNTSSAIPMARLSHPVNSLTTSNFE